MRAGGGLAPLFLALAGLVTAVGLFTTGCAPTAARAIAGRRDGDTRYIARDYRGAYRSYAASLLDSSRLVNVAGPEDEARGYYNLGLTLEKLGNYVGEREVMGRARDLARAKGERKLELQAEKSLADSIAFRGDYPESRLALNELMAKAGKEFGPVDLAGIHRSLAVAAGALGDFPGLKAEATEARKLSAGAKDADGEAAAMVLLSYWHASQAEFDAGLTLLAEAEKVMSSSREPDLAPMLLARGEILRSCGRYREALSTDTAAHAAARASKVEEAEAVAESSLGLDWFVLGDLERAEGRFRRALRIHRAMGARDDEARQLFNLGRIASAKRNWSESTLRLSEARSLYQSQGLDLGRAVCEMALAQSHRSAGDPASSLVLLASASATFKAAGERNGQAEAAVETALTQIALGRPRDAAMTASSALNAGDPDLRWRARYARGKALALSNDPEGALVELSKSIDLLEGLRQSLKLASLQSGFAASRQKLAVYQETVRLLADRGRATEAFDLVERARGRAFLDQAGNRAVDLAVDGDPLLVAEERKLAARITQLTIRLESGFASPAPARLGNHSERLAEEIDRLRSAHQEKVQEIAGRNPKLAELVSVKTLGLRDVQARLPAGTALVEYFIATDRLYIWLVEHSGSSLTTVSVPSDELLSQANLLRVALEQNLPLADALSRKLYDWLVAPVAGKLGKNRLLVVPHLSLHYVPFAALRGPGGEALLERHVIQMLPSASALRILEPVASKPPVTLLASGNPKLAQAIEDLPFAEEEIRRISSGFRSRVLLRGEATEARFRQEIASHQPPDLVHVACHAELNPVDPLSSAVLLAAGAGQDGELTVQEIYGLKLSAPVVTLSGCETAIGPVSQGDEVIGLARAFLTAGASAVVASLWQVDDEATAKLAEAFYANLKSGGRAEALRAAQLTLMRASYGPHYWAPFVWQGL